MTPTDIASLVLAALAFVMVIFLAIQQRKMQRFFQSAITPLFVEKVAKKRTVILFYVEGQDDPAIIKYVASRSIAAAQLAITSSVYAFQFADEIDVQLGSVGVFVAYTNHSPLYKRVPKAEID